MGCPNFIYPTIWPAQKDVDLQDQKVDPQLKVKIQRLETQKRAALDAEDVGPTWDHRWSWGKAAGTRKNNGKCWVSTRRTKENPWKTMENNGKPWKTHGKQWKTIENPWKMMVDSNLARLVFRRPKNFGRKQKSQRIGIPWYTNKIAIWYI